DRADPAELTWLARGTGQRAQRHHEHRSRFQRVTGGPAPLSNVFEPRARRGIEGINSWPRGLQWIPGAALPGRTGGCRTAWRRTASRMPTRPTITTHGTARPMTARRGTTRPATTRRGTTRRGIPRTVSLRCGIPG